MNATVPANLRIVSATSRTAVIDVYGFDMECEFEFEEAEPAIHFPTDRAHPGSPANVQLLECRVCGENIYDMLCSDQIERIEERLISQMEGA